MAFEPLAALRMAVGIYFFRLEANVEYGRHHSKQRTSLKCSIEHPTVGITNALTNKNTLTLTPPQVKKNRVAVFGYKD